MTCTATLWTGTSRDRPARRPVMRVAVHDEIRPVRPDRRGQPTRAEKGPDRLRLADERVLHRRVVQEDDGLVTAGDLFEAALERFHLEGRLAVDLP